PGCLRLADRRGLCQPGLWRIAGGPGAVASAAAAVRVCRGDVVPAALPADGARLAVRPARLPRLCQRPRSLDAAKLPVLRRAGATGRLRLSAPVDGEQPLLRRRTAVRGRGADGPGRAARGGPVDPAQVAGR